ncbi:hypothetical protein RHMOL_Rhmol06G0223200 [Rhododendron molle]|uniref:Uncharacterized protein n=1 Tax=Rhododendron molle TaxID=49168 RepID=A0ACC0NEZ3_RHOML|nr:hypothetical protein RHMOL_Rhmol06G0223200 [Rhododendron molle]
MRSKREVGIGNSIPWHIVFVTSLFCKFGRIDTKKKKIENVDILPSVSAWIIISYSQEIVQAFKSPLLCDPHTTCLNSLSKPLEGAIKLNTDGCWYEAYGRGGFGGLFQDHNGDWIVGYYGKGAFTSSLEADIWSVHKGLEIILERKLENVKIESDSLNVVNLINEGNPNLHPQSVMINETHHLTDRTNTTIGHTYRTTN